ncbi:MAG TPA: hypothetical protein VF235_00120 [Actinomycetota bacterium]
MTGSGFVAEPVIGWRTWGLRQTLDGPELIPITGNRGAWPARRALVAGCRPYPAHARQPGDHPAPRLDCSCGIYASDSLHSLVRSGPGIPPAPVIGTVALWGTVIEHARGYRARFAYPDRLRLLCGACFQLRAGIGVPTTVVELRPMAGRPMALIPWCAEHLTYPREGTVREHPAHDIQGALLERYAVDLLPFERIHEVFERPQAPRPRPASPPPAPTPTPARTPTPTPAPAAAPSAPLVRRRRSLKETVADVAGTVVGIVFWALMFWAYCAEHIVEIPVGQTTPSPVPVAAPVFEGALARPAPTPSPAPDFEVVCGEALGERIEFARCGSPRGNLLGLATRPPDGRCGEGTRAVTRTGRYRICWIWFSHEDVAEHPWAPNPFARSA